MSAAVCEPLNATYTSVAASIPETIERYGPRYNTPLAPVTHVSPNTGTVVLQSDSSDARGMTAIVYPEFRYQTLRVRRPFLVSIRDDDEDDVYVASDQFSTVYGAGDTVTDAIIDYFDGLVEMVEILAERSAQLSDRLAGDLAEMLARVQLMR